MLTSDGASILGTLFTFGYNMMSLPFPGTTLSIFQVFISALVTVFIIGLIKNFLSLGGSAGSIGSHFRGGNSRRVRDRDD